MRKQLATLILPAMALMLGVAVPVQAGLINGGFEQYSSTASNNAPSQLYQAALTSATGYTTLTGWTVEKNTYGFLMAPGVADTTGSYSPQYNNYLKLYGSNDGGSVVLPNTSPDGGNYVVLDAAGSYRGGGISQTLTGLTVGQLYAVSFDWASGQQAGFSQATSESLQVSFGSNQIQTTAVANNVAGGFTPWQKQTFLFTADGVSDTLNFLALSGPTGQPPMVLLDGVNFAAVPEPGSLALMGIGIAVTAVVHRCRRKKAAQSQI